MTDELTLRAAIAAAPDDDAPRLVLADLLTARGDPHGEVIVAQCRAAKLPPDSAEAKKLRSRAEALLETGWKAYAGELAPYIGGWGAFERGFVRDVRMTVAAFAKHGARLFTTYPLHTLAFAKPLTDADLTRLASTPALAHVRGLHLSQRDRAASRIALAPLAESTHLQRLEHLDFWFCGRSAADWDKLFSRLDAPALRSLRFVYNYSSSTLPAAIANNPALAGLRTYDEHVFQRLDRRDGYGELAQRVALEHLDLSSHDTLDATVVAPCFASGSNAQLRSLSLSQSTGGAELVRAIARSPKTATLESLKLSDGGITAASVAALRASPHARALRTIDIHS